LLGTGRFAKASATYGEYVRSVGLSFVEPYFLDERIGAGIDLFAKQTLANSYFSYGTESIGGTLKFGIPIREDLSAQLRYSLYTQSIQLPWYLNDCNNLDPNFVTSFPTPAAVSGAVAGAAGGVQGAYPGTNGTNSYTFNSANNLQTSCAALGQASLPIRVELANGTTLTSALGYGLVYSTLDNNKNPTSGININWGQDFAGVGGDVSYMRSIIDFHSYYEPVSDLVSVLHLQGGNILGLGTDTVRMLDDFKMGPNLVRGFQPAGIGPRDITNYQYGYGTGDEIGGTMYWGASIEMQYPLYFMPKDSGFTGAMFVDSGSVWGYKGETSNPSTGEVNGLVQAAGGSFVCSAPPSPVQPGSKGSGCQMIYTDDDSVRLSAGVSLIWNSPFGPLRFDLAYPILKQWYDRTQYFQFGGGTHF
jgi:outer membrane protein insertion porin family